MTRHPGHVAALAGLPGMTPNRLRLILRHHGPVEGLDAVCGRRPLHAMVARSLALGNCDVREAMRRSAQRCNPDALGERCAELDVGVTIIGDVDYPSLLANDARPPAALFFLGDLTALSARRVGIIGTRNATTSGRMTARDLGAALAIHGVAVVSGLARGIDGAAHVGALSTDGGGRPIAVVGNGLDVPYPKQHADLWAAVAHSGLIVSEWPPGTTPEPFRFPLRNRILAALCEVLVVVESRERGGSLITATEALHRSVDVMAVPGSPRSRASAGTNQLLRDGAAPVTAIDDVFMALGLDHRRSLPLPFDSRPIPTGVDAMVLAACTEVARSLDEIASQLSLGVTESAMSLARLERDGWLLEAGGWFESAGSRVG